MDCSSVLIPCLWPIYALSVGQFDLWVDGITAQANRQSEGDNNLPSDSKLSNSFRSTLNVDPIFLIIGIGGLLYAAVRKELAHNMGCSIINILLFYRMGLYFHLVPIFPPFCIAAALLIVRVFKFQLWRRLIFSHLNIDS